MTVNSDKLIVTVNSKFHFLPQNVGNELWNQKFLSLEQIVSEEAWQSVKNHDQSIENMTKGRHEESSLFFLERLENNPCQKQDLRHEHGITF